MSETDAPIDLTGDAPAGPLFQCRGIEAGYGAVRIVRSFDLTAEAGTVIAILGPNVAGIEGRSEPTAVRDLQL